MAKATVSAMDQAQWQTLPLHLHNKPALEWGSERRFKDCLRNTDQRDIKNSCAISKGKKTYNFVYDRRVFAIVIISADPEGP